MQNYTAIHLEKGGVVFEADGETFWKSKTQVVFPRYAVNGTKKESIVSHWRSLIEDLPVIRRETRFSRRLGREVIELDTSETNLRHYDPIGRLKLLRRSERGFHKQINNLCDILERIGIDTNKLGIRGSLLVGSPHEFSDIDLLIYGHENKETLFNDLKGFYSSPRISILVKNKRITQELYMRRSDHFSGMSPEYFLSHEKRRVQGVIDDKIRFVFSTIEETTRGMGIKRIIPICPATIVGEVINNSGTFYDPSLVQVKPKRLLLDKEDSAIRREIMRSTVGNKNMCVKTYGDPICAVVFFPGDVLKIMGFFEKVENTKGRESFQLAIRPADDCKKQIKLVTDIGIHLW